MAGDTLGQEMTIWKWREPTRIPKCNKKEESGELISTSIIEARGEIQTTCADLCGHGTGESVIMYVNNGLSSSTEKVTWELV